PLAPVAKLYFAKATREGGAPEAGGRALASLEGETLPPNLTAEIESEKTALREELLQNGLKYYRQDDYARALASIDTALQLGPDDNAAILRGMTLLRLRDPDRAREV